MNKLLLNEPPLMVLPTLASVLANLPTLKPLQTPKYIDLVSKK